MPDPSCANFQFDFLVDPIVKVHVGGEDNIFHFDYKLQGFRGIASRRRNQSENTLGQRPLEPAGDFQIALG